MSDLKLGIIRDYLNSLSMRQLKGVGKLVGVKKKRNECPNCYKNRIEKDILNAIRDVRSAKPPPPPNQPASFNGAKDEN